MRSPQQVAKEIREELSKKASKRSDYSVRCVSGYKIIVQTDSIDKEEARKIVKEVYHKENHHWLCVCVNNYWVPMPPLVRDSDDVLSAILI